MSLIKRPLIITINGNKASLNEVMYFYEGDKNIDFEFTISDIKYKFNHNSGNILVDSNASFAVVKVLKPNGDKFMTEQLPIDDNVVILPITEEFADTCDECGTYIMQIHLYSDESEDSTGKRIQGRITVPPVSFEVYNPIFHDNKTNCGDSDILTVSCRRVVDE